MLSECSFWNQGDPARRLLQEDWFPAIQLLSRGAQNATLARRELNAESEAIRITGKASHGKSISVCKPSYSTAY